MIQTQRPPSPAADALWRALHSAGEDGLSTIEAVNRGLASEPYARRRFSRWAKAGFVSVEEGGSSATPHRYRLTPAAPFTPPVITAAGEAIDVTPSMQPSEFAVIRRRLGLSASAMGEALGWTGHPNSITRAIRRFEAGKRPIDAALAAKVRALNEG